MSGDMTPKIPPEMFDAIIDQVYTLNERDGDVEKLLGVSSLVSKSWLPRSRRHLFRKVTFNREERIHAFMDLLDSPLCTFKPSCVQILELYGFWPLYALPRLSTLPAVRDLKINGGIFTSNSAKSLSHFHNLHDLVLYACSFDSTAQLLETLSICKSLKSLCLYVLEMHSDSPCIVNSRTPSSLRSVQIQTAGCSSSDMMGWLVSGDQVPAIETLILTRIQADESRAIGHCLRRLGPSLKNLEVGFTTGTSRIDSENAFLRDVDLSYNVNLNSICFTSGPIPAILAQVTSSKVREVVVEATFEMLRKVEWDTIARILDQPHFSKLEKFIIPGGTFHDVEEVRHWLMQRLLPGRVRDKIICERWYGNYRLR